MLNKILKLFQKQKEPTLLEKVDKWQTEMYLYKPNKNVKHISKPRR